MKNIILSVAIFVAAATSSFTPLYGNDSPQKTDDLTIKVLEAHQGGVVKVEISNKTTHSIRIWTQYNSWGWGNWTFEFFDKNQLIVFVRKPDQGFTFNLQNFTEIPASKALIRSFDLSDGTWVFRTIPMWPTYPSKEDKENAIGGCFAVLAIPNSTESKTLDVWTGVATSPLH